MPSGIFNKIIISDTSCLIAFANIGRFDILQSLCHSVIVTPEVADEYKDPLPDWVQIKCVKDTVQIKSLNAFLGLGESSAIALALETENSLLILDDKKARSYAQTIGLDIIGILGLLIQAHKAGFLTNLDKTLAELREVGFRLPANTDQLINQGTSGSTK
jgi:predicted nucleic acid-binding protein